MTSNFVVTSCALLLYAGAAMVLTPLMLSRRRWTSQFPRTAIGVWLLALATGTIAALTGVGYAIHAAKTFATHSDRSLSSGSIINGITLTLLVCLITSLTGGLAAAAIYRAGLSAVHRRHLYRTLGVLRPQPSNSRREAAIIDSDEANAISVAGRNPQILISSLLRDQLDPAQFDAVVEHERAHLAQHHHALLQLADLQYRCAPVLPCARALDQSLHLLVELAADDHAARRCGTDATASALRALGALTKDESYPLRALRLENRRTLTRH